MINLINIELILNKINEFIWRIVNISNNFNGILFNIIIIIKLLDTCGVDADNLEYSENVYKIPQDIQMAAMENEKVKCLLKMLDKNYTLSMPLETTDKGWCPITFDRIMCWDEAPPNTIIRLDCPKYVDTFRINGSVTKTCTSNGTWYMKGNLTWSNYSECTTHDMTRWRQVRNIYVMGQVGYGISLFTLIIAIAILCSFRRLRCDRNYIHLNLFIAFLLRAIFYFPTLVEQKHRIFCRLLRVANNYFLQASYQSIFTEALYMHNIIFCHTLDSSRAHAAFYIIPCWLVPAIVTGIWSTLRYLYNNVFCWDLSVDVLRRDFWLLNSYVILLTLANCVLFLRLTCSLCSKVNSHISQEREKYRKLARSICVLVIVFGVYNVIFIPLEVMSAFNPGLESSNIELVKLYMQHLVNSCQGFLVSLLLCFINGEVHREIKTFIRNKLPMLTYDTTIHCNNINNNNNNDNNMETKKYVPRSRRSQLYEYAPASRQSIVVSEK